MMMKFRFSSGNLDCMHITSCYELDYQNEELDGFSLCHYLMCEFARFPKSSHVYYNLKIFHQHSFPLS